MSNTIMAKALDIDMLGFDSSDVRLVHKYRLQVIENIKKVNILLGRAPKHEALNSRYKVLKEQLAQLDLAYIHCPGQEIVYKSYL